MVGAMRCLRRCIVTIFLSVALLFVVSCEEWWYAETEDNGSYATATAFPSNNKISGRIPESTDEDYFYDLIYRGTIVTYTLKEWTEPLQLMLYYQVPEPPDDTDYTNNIYELLIGANKNEVESFDRVSITYPQPDDNKFDDYPLDSYLEVFVLVEPADGFTNSSSYWLTKSVAK